MCKLFFKSISTFAASFIENSDPQVKEELSHCNNCLLWITQQRQWARRKKAKSRIFHEMIKRNNREKKSFRI